jgi:predicted nucleic acid-binding protein
LEQACQGLGAGERGAILLAKSLSADLLLLDERKARRIAREAGLTITGCLGVLELGARRGLISDLRLAYINLLRQGIRFDIGLLQDSLARLGLPKL